MKACACTLPHTNPRACDGCPNNIEYDSISSKPYDYGHLTRRYIDIPLIEVDETIDRDIEEYFAKKQEKKNKIRKLNKLLENWR